MKSFSNFKKLAEDWEEQLLDEQQCLVLGGVSGFNAANGNNCPCDGNNRNHEV